MWWFIVFDFINLVWLQIVPRLNCHAQMASDLKKDQNQLCKSHYFTEKSIEAHLTRRWNYCDEFLKNNHLIITILVYHLFAKQ